MAVVVEEQGRSAAREVVTLVLVEAFGSSLTPFVPLPFVDGFLLARLFRSITRKVIEQRGDVADERVVKDIVSGYIKESKPPLNARAFKAAARFIIRKVAVVLDVKKSHDVFGEAIVYALALDVALDLCAISGPRAFAVGGAMYRAMQTVGSGAIEVLTRAGREAFASSSSADSSQTSSRLSRVAEAIGKHVDNTRNELAPLMRRELGRERRQG